MGFREGNFSRGSSGGGFRRGGFSGRRSFDGPREMTKINCAKCGKEDEVPFKPREGSQVLCKDCYFKEKGIEPRQKPSFNDGEVAKAEPAEAKKKPVEEGSDDVEFNEEADFDDAEESKEEI